MPGRRTRHPRTMIVLDGCVQPRRSPTSTAAARVLDAIGISLIRAPGEGCCGAVPFHLNAQEEALGYARRNIDAWWPYIEAGAEAVVITASGCGTLVVDYGHLAPDPAYGPKAASVNWRATWPDRRRRAGAVERRVEAAVGSGGGYAWPSTLPAVCNMG